MRIGKRIGWYLWRALLRCSVPLQAPPGPVPAQRIAEVESQLLDVRAYLTELQLQLAEEELQGA